MKKITSFLWALLCCNAAMAAVGNTFTTNAVEESIAFADSKVKELCVDNWDTNQNGVLEKGEAAAVTSLGDVFKNQSTITSFDELAYFTGLTAIDNSAFQNCSQLQSITIPEGVTSIGNQAFNFNVSLTTINIPNTVTSIGDKVFLDCWGLTTFTIPSGVTRIGEAPFQGCSNLTSLSVDAQNTYYNSGSSDSNVIIETATHTLIQGCKTSQIPVGVTSIGKRAFYTVHLTSVTIPEGVKSIGEYAFYSSGLTSVTIPEGVKSIGERAFSANNLTSVSLPSSVASIGYKVFDDCGYLSKIEAYNKTPITIVYESWMGEATGDFIVGDFRASNIDLYIPIGCTDAYKAAGWTNFKSYVEVSKKIVFADDKVKTVCVAHWDTSNDGELDEQEAAAVTTLGEAFKANEDIEEFPELSYFTGLTSIGQNDFKGCLSLRNITIPENVTSIDRLAFYNAGSNNTDFRIRLPYTLCNTDYEYVSYLQLSPYIIPKQTYATFACGIPVDMLNKKGLTAYVASSFDNNTLTLTKISYAKAGEGLVLMFEEAEKKYSFSFRDVQFQNQTQPNTTNLMKGVTTSQTLNTTDGDYTNFILTNGTEGVGFYKTSGGTLAAGKAYLQLPTSDVASARGIKMSFEDGELSGIAEVSKNGAASEAIYNLNGQRITNGVRQGGLYIVNGKKVYVK